MLLLGCDEDTAELFEWALGDAGFRVSRISFGAPVPPDFVPDLVVAHMRQPDAALVRSMLGGKHVTTILVTGWMERGTTPANAGCDALLLLPVEPRALVDKARELLHV